MSNATTTEDKRAALIACITSNADARSAALLRTAEMFEGDDALSAEYLRHAAGSDRIDFISAVIRACFKVLA